MPVNPSDQQEFSDADFRVVDNGDQSKKLAFQVSGLTTATTRTWTAPDASGTVALTSDLAAYQPLDADLTSWAAITRASGFDTFTATPSSANLASLVTGETGSGALVFGTAPTFTTSIALDSGAAITALDFGTYTPTLTNTTNVAASTAFTTAYFRIGNVVHVFGTVTIDATTTATITVLGISLPIASDFASSVQLSGTGAANGVTGTLVSEVWAARADTTNDRASFVSVVGTDANHSISFHFSYLVI